MNTNCKKMYTNRATLKHKYSKLGTNDFDDLEDFIEWCEDTGYQYGYQLSRRDTSRPHGPENSFWLTPDPDINPCDACPKAQRCGEPCELRYAHWDAVMDRIRRDTIARLGRK